MNAFQVVKSFVGSRRWLLSVMVVSVSLAGLVAMLQTAPEIERESAATPGDEPVNFDAVVTHPIQDVGIAIDSQSPMWGARLTGTIEEIPGHPSVRVTAELIEPPRERR